MTIKKSSYITGKRVGTKTWIKDKLESVAIDAIKTINKLIAESYAQFNANAVWVQLHSSLTESDFPTR